MTEHRPDLPRLRAMWTVERRRPTVIGALALLVALLLLPAAPAPAAPAVPFDEGPSLAGRNCGGTSKPGSVPLAATAALGGQGWTLGGALDTPPAAANQLSPSVAAGPAGQIFYAWQETRGADTGDIFAAPLGGAPPTGRRGVRVDDTGVAAVEQAAPSLAVDASGALHVVWEDLRGGGLRRLFYASSANNGASWSANTLLTGALPALSHRSPHLVAGPDGALYLAWDSGSDILFSRRVGGVWSAPAPINAPRDVDRDLPRLAFDDAGRLLAAWEDRRGAAPAIYVARLDQPAGGAWGAEVRATPVGVAAAQPSLAVGADGALYLAYQGAPGIFIVVSADGGASWGAPQRLDDGSGNAFTNPRLAVDAAGGVHCIWCQLQVGFAAVVAARSTDGGDSWGDRVTLASTTGTAEPLDLIAGADGLYAAWSDDGSGRPLLHTARWTGERLWLPLLRR